MAAQQTDADNNDFQSQFRRHFPGQSNDISLVVLKGHLLLEEIFNRWLAALVHKPEAMEGANLRFHQKLYLIRALTPVGGGDTVFRALDAAEKLNTMRNRLAHHLDHPQIEALARDFLSLCEHADAGDPNAKTWPLITNLKRAIAWVCLVCEGMSKGVQAVRDPNR
jgi:hypothetical protein